MKKTPEKAYHRMNYDIYDRDSDTWWQPNTFLNLIKTVINPVRVEYAKRTIADIFPTNPGKINILEVGCGGGLLTEEFAQLGYNVSGIDPSEPSLQAAMLHSKSNNLEIKYLKGTGENIPFNPASFDVVLCCDVLEHVQDLSKVISEVSRVLKKGGVFVYDTYNRNAFSKISVINILQEWRRWAVMPRGLHVWEMFIRPGEIRSLLSENGMTCVEHLGIEPNVSYINMLGYLRKRAKGELSYEEFGSKVRMVESRSTLIMYIGYAIKN
jgi:2-polyprenyl-6-hydroxyphenyl methylase / 3-demethylubiquinone-9 3-methyltransferase